MAGTARVKEAPVIIAAAKIKRYVRVSVLAAAREKQRKKMRDQLVPLLESGAVCDTKSPYELYILPVEKSKVPWREIAEKYITRDFGPDAEAEIKRLEKVYEDVEKHLKTRPLVPEMRDCQV
jgi:hypothetical protein